MTLIFYLATNLGHALKWSALYAAVVLAVLLGLVAVAMSVALFAKDDRRASRAYQIFIELLRLFRQRGPR